MGSGGGGIWRSAEPVEDILVGMHLLVECGVSLGWWAGGVGINWMRGRGLLFVVFRNC